MGNDNIINKEAKTEAEKKHSVDSEEDYVDLLHILDSFWKKLVANRTLIVAMRRIFVFFVTLLIAFSAVMFVLYFVPVLTEMVSGSSTLISSDKGPGQSAGYKKQISLVNRDIQRMSRKYNAYTTGQSYIVINTTDNRFYLFRNKILIREGFCSSGSYTMLQTAGDKQWVFKTPKGKYWIRGKTTNPVWKKPDWAFVEEGLPIPSINDNSRFEYGVLGDYALSIGDGYMIHGTIYKRFLGMPVTHGCVRLNDEDLKVIYNNLNVGSKVYIF